ncbi:DNA mismatch repair endonuclease MutL [Bacillus canaveralius]|uniref:DNA mismatch repair endonuclease MutL n=1 Tax=Bacillus canaveralius TaxID=1403243 RepID=UPI000F76CACA|nr:DNA mismatch repair endonuclease MutL [Bacillus canaveralius]RSK47832.1 DNA mismatch repair endonuclease MutL [Bacillus canaveralius]
MGRIIQLDDALSNKIAAGEVVERPASVVKELVENAIDAGSTLVEVEAEEAGLAKIRVIDNGDGIDAEDVPVAFQRHATSKIKDETDLFRIRTLGFRGEALPSIASVARLEMKTSTGTVAGTRIVIEGGKIEVIEKAASRKGTDISITDLFFNTPARLKYMKTIHTELGNITDVLNRLALANPHVSIRFVHNGRKLLHTNGNGDVRQVLAAIYGLNIVKSMTTISAESLDFTISGFISVPEVTRASRNYISTMINGRFIKNYQLVKAIQEGYHTLLPIGRFPIALLHIEMDPLLVDVNVHPSKMEVRLSKEHELNELISNSIKQTFKSKTLIPTGFVHEKKARPVSEQTAFELDHLPAHENRDQSFNSRRSMEGSRNESTIKEPANTFQPVEATNPAVSADPQAMNQEVFERPTDDDDFFFEKTDQQLPERVPPLYPIGQMHGTYIIAQNDKGLYIIDQHAAQERIKYEFYKERVGDVASELQELLVPLTFEYSADEYIKIEEYQDELEKVGVFLEPFGNNSFIVRSHPQWLPKGDEPRMIEGMIEQLLAMKKVDIKKLREEAAIMMSCKASIKANHYLRHEDMQALLDKLRQTTDPFTCPHGRPIIIHYSTYEMEKMFKRVM